MKYTKQYWLLMLFYGCLVVAGCGTAAPQLGGTHAPALRRIVNGFTTPQNTFLTAQQQLAIGFVVEMNEHGDSGEVFCSGTIIHPRVVATARHCFKERKDVDRLVFVVGSGPEDVQGWFSVESVLSHEDIDFSAMVLQSSATEEQDLTPIAFNHMPFSPAWIGHWVDAVGFGKTVGGEQEGIPSEEAPPPGRYFAPVEVTGCTPIDASVDGHGGGFCGGDSGGPIIWQPDAKTSPLVIGVEQKGDPNCGGKDTVVRADVVRPWLQERLLPFDIDLGYVVPEDSSGEEVPEDPCASLPPDEEPVQEILDDEPVLDVTPDEPVGDASAPAPSANIEDDPGYTTSESQVGCAAIDLAASPGLWTLVAAAWLWRRRAAAPA